jgi:pyruvate dehydrogenase E1 component alpha subunit
MVGKIKNMLKKQPNTQVMAATALKQAYYDMVLIRRFEERCTQLYGMGKIGGFCHLYIGQEAVAVGVKNAIREGDATVTSYRDHGIMLAAGSDPKVVMAELLGRVTGCSKGKGGSMHMFDLPKRFYGGHGIVGAQVPIGTGLAFAYQYRGEDSLAVAFMGDGAVNQGQVYESFNMAKLWKLPVLYIVENNEYSMGTAVARSCATVDLYQRGASFGIPGKRVDGMNFFEVKAAVEEACEYIRAGNGPMLLEMKTYRYRGHSMSDPGKYRTKEEVEEYRKIDPIEQLKTYILKNKVATEADLKELENKVKDMVAESVEFSLNSPEPEEDELYRDVYVEN